MTILDELAEYAKLRTRQAKEKVPLSAIKKQANALEKGTFAFENALKTPGISFICECKKASPSKGIIVEDFPYIQIAKEYESAGADCISVLTEPKWFLGSDTYLKKIADAVSIPCIRKDFIVDEYMIYEAKLLICDSLGISALVEVHDENEVKMAIDAGARIIGVNNRNLRDFSIDSDNCRRLRKLVPKDILFVAESGVKTPQDIQSLSETSVDAVLIGETLMRAEDKKAKLDELKALL